MLPEFRARVRAAHSNSSHWRFAPKTKRHTLGVLGGSISLLFSLRLCVRFFVLGLPCHLIMIPDARVAATPHTPTS